MEIRRARTRSKSPSLTRFLPNCFGKFRKRQHGRRACRRTTYLQPPVNGKETELCAEWKMYVEPELRRLFQTATQTVGADLEQLNGNEKSLQTALCAFRPNMPTHG
jgi:hypothetical protein